MANIPLSDLYASFPSCRHHYFDICTSFDIDDDICENCLRNTIATYKRYYKEFRLKRRKEAN